MIGALPEPLVARRSIHASRLDEDAVKVVRRLVRFGHQAYLVGGCVRDLLLGLQPKDFDVATSARPPQLRKLFRNCRIIGRRFRLAHMLFRDGKVIEVATFRREPEDRAEDGDLLLLQDNVFGDPHEDALRRDFTINALFYDVAPGNIIDYVGGLVDVERRLLRTIGDPDIRIQEDPVRILRAIKFSARQDLGIDPALYEAAIRHRSLLARSAPPRVFEEVLRLMRGSPSRWGCSARSSPSSTGSSGAADQRGGRRGAGSRPWTP
jgi:poly(A) polymerase